MMACADSPMACAHSSMVCAHSSMACAHSLMANHMSRHSTRSSMGTVCLGLCLVTDVLVVVAGWRLLAAGRGMIRFSARPIARWLLVIRSHPFIVDGGSVIGDLISIGFSLGVGPSIHSGLIFSPPQFSKPGRYCNCCCNSDQSEEPSNNPSNLHAGLNLRADVAKRWANAVCMHDPCWAIPYAWLAVGFKVCKGNNIELKSP